MFASFRCARIRRDRGATLVEFALVVPLLCLVLFGIIDFGWAYNRESLLNNATREGAREAALNPDRGDIESVVRSSLGGRLGSGVTIETRCVKTPAANCTLNNRATNVKGNVAPGDRIVVTVRYVHDWVTFVPRSVGMGSTTTLTKSTEMRVE